MIDRGNFGLYPQLLFVNWNVVSIHIQNLRALMTEIFKALNGLSPDILSERKEKGNEVFP